MCLSAKMGRAVAFSVQIWYNVTTKNPCFGGDSCDCIRTAHRLSGYLTGGGVIMAYKITDACIACGACAAQCPVEAIAEGDGKFEIGDACIECGACAAQCPVEAIVEE